MGLIVNNNGLVRSDVPNSSGAVAKDLLKLDTGTGNYIPRITTADPIDAICMETYSTKMTIIVGNGLIEKHSSTWGYTIGATLREDTTTPKNIITTGSGKIIGKMIGTANILNANQALKIVCFDALTQAGISTDDLAALTISGSSYYGVSGSNLIRMGGDFGQTYSQNISVSPGTITTDANNIYTVDNASYVVACLDKKSLVQKWSLTITNAPIAGITALGLFLYVSHGSGGSFYIDKINISTGSIVSTTPYGTPPAGGISVTNNGTELYVLLYNGAGGSTSNILKIDPATMSTLGSVSSSSLYPTSSYSVYGNRLYWVDFAAFGSYNTAYIDTVTMTAIASSSLTTYSVAAFNNAVYISDGTTTTKLNPTTMAIVSTLNVGGSLFQTSSTIMGVSGSYLVDTNSDIVLGRFATAISPIYK